MWGEGWTNQLATYARKLEAFVPLRIERHHDRLALGPLSRQHQFDIRIGLTIEVGRFEPRRTHLSGREMHAQA